MFKKPVNRLPLFILTLVACFVSVSGQAGVISLWQEPETEVADSLKVKEFYQRSNESRRLRLNQAHHPLWRMLKPSAGEKIDIPEDSPLIPDEPPFSSSPPLRAPPS